LLLRDVSEGKQAATTIGLEAVLRKHVHDGDDAAAFAHRWLPDALAGFGHTSEPFWERGSSDCLL
jgi:hypothetical protein